MTIRGKNITFTRNPAMPKEHNAALEFIAQKVETAGSHYCAYHDTDNRACGVGWMMSRETRRQIKKEGENSCRIASLVHDHFGQFGKTSEFESEMGMPLMIIREIQEKFDQVINRPHDYPEPHKEIAKRIRSMKV